jgi:hypothetical protein
MHNHEAHDDRNRGKRRSPRRAGAMAAGLVALGLSVAACSAGSNSSGVASVSSSAAAGKTSSPSSGKASALAYSQCMQSHGIKNFPEPNSSGQLTVTKGESLPDTSSPQFQAAVTVCRSLNPAGVAPNAAQAALHLQQDIAYAKCMRSHGLTNFPDPDPSTGDSFNLQGIDVNSSQVQSANKACGGNGNVGINQANRTS